MPGIEQAIVSFGRELRAGGLRVGVDQHERLARSLRWINPLSRQQVYYAARASYLYRIEDRPIFDAVFERFWPSSSLEPPGVWQKAPLAPRHDPSRWRRPALASFLDQRARVGDPEVDVVDRRDTASDTEIIRRKDFAKMSSDELRSVRQALAGMRWRVAQRRTRRRVADRHGDRLDMRRMFRRGILTGGTVFHFPRRSRKIKRRPLVLIADISGSMELYSRILLHFFHAIQQNLSDTETFVFGTRLTRITEQLVLRNVDHALDEVSGEVVDFAGGTRIGQSLGQFNRVWNRRLLHRGAVVLVISDGWERGDPQLLRRQVRRIQSRCHRLIWLNPRLGHVRYEPRVEGMAAVLDQVDDFLPIHNLQSLRDLSEHLAGLPARKTATARGQR